MEGGETSGGTGTWRGRKTEGTPSLGHESSRLPTTRAPCPRPPPSSPRHPKHTHTHALAHAHTHGRCCVGLRLPAGADGCGERGVAARVA